MSQLTIGMLSIAVIGRSHRGHRERGDTTERSCGHRVMHTLRNDPTHAPIANARSSTGHSITVSARTGEAPRQPPRSTIRRRSRAATIRRARPDHVRPRSGRHLHSRPRGPAVAAPFHATRPRPAHRPPIAVWPSDRGTVVARPMYNALWGAGSERPLRYGRLWRSTGQRFPEGQRWP